jgi:hypothetical protein
MLSWVMGKNDKCLTLHASKWMWMQVELSDYSPALPSRETSTVRAEVCACSFCRRPRGHSRGRTVGCGVAKLDGRNMNVVRTAQ